MVRQIEDTEEKRRIARAILEALPDWFELPEARERYIAESAEQIVAADVEDGRPRGFLCLRETGKDTAELSVMGIRREYHRKGIGRELVRFGEELARKQGYSFLQVKTVQMGKYEEYDRTNLFYRSLGFREFEVIPSLWGEENPCQIYVKAI